MEIEVNEYVKTKEGEIHKVIKIIEDDGDWDYYCCGNNAGYFAMDIANHSKHLIDLIEVGDFVNGYRVLAIKPSIYENSKRILIYKNERENYERWIYIQEYNGRIHTQDDIVEILTKEQYLANCYKVEEEE